jgi:hypothetical protein
MLNHTRPGEVIYEPFLGSGTTLIAAETTGRVCLAIELDPLYIDVALRRWQAFTGAKATLQANGRAFDDVAQERLCGPTRAKSCEETKAAALLPILPMSRRKVVPPNHPRTALQQRLTQPATQAAWQSARRTLAPRKSRRAAKRQGPTIEATAADTATPNPAPQRDRSWRRCRHRPATTPQESPHMRGRRPKPTRLNVLTGTLFFDRTR